MFLKIKFFLKKLAGGIFEEKSNLHTGYGSLKSVHFNHSSGYGPMNIMNGHIFKGNKENASF